MAIRQLVEFCSDTEKKSKERPNRRKPVRIQMQILSWLALLQPVKLSDGLQPCTIRFCALMNVRTVKFESGARAERNKAHEQTACLNCSRRLLAAFLNPRAFGPIAP
jgi:hypothetical protein